MFQVDSNLGGFDRDSFLRRPVEDEDCDTCVVMVWAFMVFVFVARVLFSLVWVCIIVMAVRMQQFGVVFLVAEFNQVAAVRT